MKIRFISELKYYILFIYSFFFTLFICHNALDMSDAGKFPCSNKQRKPLNWSTPPTKYLPPYKRSTNAHFDTTCGTTTPPVIRRYHMWYDDIICAVNFVQWNETFIFASLSCSLFIGFLKAHGVFFIFTTIQKLINEC